MSLIDGLIDGFYKNMRARTELRTKYKLKPAPLNDIDHAKKIVFFIWITCS